MVVSYGTGTIVNGALSLVETTWDSRGSAGMRLRVTRSERKRVRRRNGGRYVEGIEPTALLFCFAVQARVLGNTVEELLTALRVANLMMI